MSKRTVTVGTCWTDGNEEYDVKRDVEVPVDPRWDRDDIFEEAETIAMNDEGIYRSICAAMEGETPQATDEYEGWALGGHQT